MDEPIMSERHRRIARAVEDLLQEGEELFLSRSDEGVLVSEAPVNPLEKEHPRLYGRLLSLDAQLEGGNLATVLGVAAVLAFWIGLQARWWEPVISEELAQVINVWWFYGVLVLLVLLLSGSLSEGRARFRYRRARSELLPLLEEANLDRDLLLVRIKDDENLTNITRQLKLDWQPFSRGPGHP